MTIQSERFVSTRGEISLSSPKDGVVVFKVSGHFDKPMGTRIVDTMEQVVSAHRRFHAFCDWAEIVSYDSEVRAMLTQWVAQHRTHGTYHMLVGSKIISMGVSVANLALGGVLVGYTNRASFDAALRAAKLGLAHVK